MPSKTAKVPPLPIAEVQYRSAQALRFKAYKKMTRRQLENRRDRLNDDVSDGLMTLAEVRTDLEFLERLITHKIAGSPNPFPLPGGKSRTRG
jgi:hypothetical protein